MLGLSLTIGSRLQFQTASFDVFQHLYLLQPGLKKLIAEYARKPRHEEIIDLVQQTLELNRKSIRRIPVGHRTISSKLISREHCPGDQPWHWEVVVKCTV